MGLYNTRTRIPAELTNTNPARLTTVFQKRSRPDAGSDLFATKGGTIMNECTTCGREYPSLLEAAICSDTDLGELEDRLAGSVYRSVN
ncbi:MAG: hypothetical protein K0R99_4909 [Microbacterium sp.]|jgi:hypothetical protein|nr:hypothetical protein [Microbacterium sp.]